jgi:hypothetical protein
MDVLPFILWTLWCLTIPAYLVLQLILLLRTSGTLRWLAALPLAFMVPAYLLFVLGMFQGGGNHLSWLLLILPSPVALFYVVIFLASGLVLPGEKRAADHEPLARG